MKKYKILSIDGGGVRGIIPARILQEIEEKSGKPIYQLFDMIVGTSTGAMIALALACTSYRIESFRPGDRLNIVKIYQKYSEYIFRKSIINSIKTGFNLWGPKYERSSFDIVLKLIFSDCKFKDCKCNVVIPCYDLIKNERVILKSWESLQTTSIKEIAGGATAAPTYFSPVNSLIDGGIWCNNPETIGVSEAITLNPELNKEDIYILSIGTGKVKLTSNAIELQNAGLLGWLKGGLINMMMETESEWTADAIKEIYPNMVRIEPDLDSTIGEFDDASDDNLRELLYVAEKYISNNPERIDCIIKELIE